MSTKSAPVIIKTLENTIEMRAGIWFRRRLSKNPIVWNPMSSKRKCNPGKWVRYCFHSKNNTIVLKKLMMKLVSTSVCISNTIVHLTWLRFISSSSYIIYIHIKKEGSPMFRMMCANSSSCSFVLPRAFMLAMDCLLYLHINIIPNSENLQFIS